MKLANAGAVPVYTVSGPSSRALPDWLVRQKKKSLKHDPEFANRLELLQDFEFTGASSCVCVSEDGNWLVSTGTFPPQMHVHNLHQLSLSYSRHTVSLNTKFVLISSDYSKSVHLQEDRRIELHTPAGCHHQVRIPRFGRDIVYDRRSTDVLVPAVGLDAEGSGEVFRLNLEAGRFQKSFQIELGSDDGVERGLQGSVGVGSVNAAAIAEQSHGLCAFGTSLGTVEFWDPRSRARVATLQSHDGEITALDFAPTGLSLMTGSGNGIVQVYDLRRPSPLLTKDLGFGSAVQTLIHMTTAAEEKKLLAADRRAIKIFDAVDGTPWTSIEPEVDISSVAHCPGTGMLFSANEGRQQHAWFVPMLGPAPRWCAFLERLVDEMADEVQTTTYDNYKFLTLPELRALSLDHLVGKTNLLRPYMHGFFVASKLHDQARLIANPYVYEEERMKRVRQKIDKDRSSRIRGHTSASSKKVKVNQKLIDDAIKRQENRRHVDMEVDGMGDDRFKDVFEDEEYVVDETTFEFNALNSSTKVDPDAASSSKETQKGKKQASHAPGGDDDSSDNEERISRRPVRASSSNGGGSGGLVMRIASSAQQRAAKTGESTIGDRVQRLAAKAASDPSLPGRVRSGLGVGEKQITFVPESSKKKQAGGNDEDEESESAATARAAAAEERKHRVRRSASGNTFRNMRK